MVKRILLAGVTFYMASFCNSLSASNDNAAPFLQAIMRWWWIHRLRPCRISKAEKILLNTLESENVCIKPQNSQVFPLHRPRRFRCFLIFRLYLTFWEWKFLNLRWDETGWKELNVRMTPLQSRYSDYSLRVHKESPLTRRWVKPLNLATNKQRYRIANYYDSEVKAFTEVNS